MENQLEKPREMELAIYLAGLSKPQLLSNTFTGYVACMHLCEMLAG